MMNTTETTTHLELGDSLARRLFPLAAVIGGLIGLLFPLAVYLSDYRNLSHDAAIYARMAAHELSEQAKAPSESAQIWVRLFFGEGDRLPFRQEICSIRVYGRERNELTTLGYHGPDSSEFWNRWAPAGTAGVTGNRDIYRVEVSLSQEELLTKTLLIAVAAAFFGWLLAFCAYSYPIRIVRRMDQEVQLLIDDLNGAVEESGRMRNNAQVSEKRFRDLVAGLDAIIWEADPVNRRYTFVSHQAERLLGAEVAEWHLGEDFFIAQVHPDDRQRVLDAYQSLYEHDTVCQIEYRRRCDDGSMVWLRDTFRMSDQDGMPRHMWGVMVDVTQRVMAEDALLELNRKLTSAVDELRYSNSEVSALYEMGELFQLCRSLDEVYQVVVSTSEKFFPNDSGVLLIYSEADNILKKAIGWGEAQDGGGCTHLAPDDCLALRSGKPHALPAGGGQRFRCPGIEEQTGCDYLCIPLKAQGQIVGVYRQCCEAGQRDSEKIADFSQRQRLVVAMTEHMALAIANMKLRETLHAQSIRDPLTSLFNRRYLEDAMLREIAQAERKEYQLGIMMIDIDHFKQFNDRYGHEAGDLLLVTFANEMTGFFREYDRVCRYGGEEFLCIIPDMELETVKLRAEKLRQLASQLRLHHLGLSLGQVTISVGIAMYPQHGASKSELVRAADAALYRAKHEGRNRVMVAEE